MTISVCKCSQRAQSCRAPGGAGRQSSDSRGFRHRVGWPLQGLRALGADSGRQLLHVDTAPNELRDIVAPGRRGVRPRAPGAIVPRQRRCPRCLRRGSQPTLQSTAAAEPAAAPQARARMGSRRFRRKPRAKRLPPPAPRGTDRHGRRTSRAQQHGRRRRSAGIPAPHSLPGRSAAIACRRAVLVTPLRTTGTPFPPSPAIRWSPAAASSHCPSTSGRMPTPPR